MTRLALMFWFCLLACVAAMAPPMAGASAKGDRCGPRAHEQVRARTASAVVLVRRGRTLVGCSPTTGARRVIDTKLRGASFFEQVRLHGTTVAYVLTDPEPGTGTDQWLYRADAVRAGRRRQLVYGAVVSVAVGPGGVVAYITVGAPDLVLRLDRPSGVVLDVDAGLHLNDVRFAEDRLRWRHGTAARSADATPVDRCGGESGTLMLALTPRSAPDGVTACVRATGATRTFATDRFHLVATSGPWVAAAPGDGTIVVANLVSGAGETISAPGADGVAVNPNGTVAWLGEQTDGRFPVLVHDGVDGTRTLGSIVDPIDFGFDGTILRWAHNVTRLPR